MNSVTFSFSVSESNCFLFFSCSLLREPAFVQSFIVKSAFVFVLMLCVLPLLCLLHWNFLLSRDLLFLSFLFGQFYSLLSVYRLFSDFYLYFHNIIVSGGIHFSPDIGSKLCLHLKNWKWITSSNSFSLFSKQTWSHLEVLDGSSLGLSWIFLGHLIHMKCLAPWQPISLILVEMILLLATTQSGSHLLEDSRHLMPIFELWYSVSSVRGSILLCGLSHLVFLTRPWSGYNLIIWKKDVWLTLISFVKHCDIRVSHFVCWRWKAGTFRGKWKTHFHRGSQCILYTNPFELPFFFAFGSLWFFVRSLPICVARSGWFSSLLMLNNVGLSDRLPLFSLQPKVG